MPTNLIINGQKISGDLPKAHPLPNRESSLILQINEKTSNAQWINYSVIFKTPRREIKFESENLLLCLSPANELVALKEQLNNFLNNPKQHLYRFEPVEPNFEITLEKEPEEGLKLTFWMDNGNADCEYYTWDALGLRLYTDINELIGFVEQLEKLSV